VIRIAKNVNIPQFSLADRPDADQFVGLSLIKDDNRKLAFSDGANWIDIPSNAELSNPLGSSLIGFEQSGTGSVPRAIGDKIKEVSVTPQDFMTNAQILNVAFRIGTIDISDAWQKAVDYLNSIGGGDLVLPPGKYRKADTSPGIDVYSNIRTVGYGDATVIFHDDTDFNPRKDLLKVSTGSENVTFENFKILGTLDTYTSDTNNSQALTGRGITNLKVIGVHFEKLRFMATAFIQVNGGVFDKCKFSDVLRDGARATHSQNIKVTNCEFYRVTDDSVALHSEDTDTNPVSQGFVVTGNTFFGCQGIKVLGGKSVTVSDNIIRFPIRNALYIGNNESIAEGNTQVFNLKIHNNTILDPFGNRGANYCVGIFLRNRSKGALPSQPGVLSPVFDYNYVNDISAAGSVCVGGADISIVGNTIGWTRKRGVNFSTYGFGELMDRPGTLNTGYFDTLVDDTSTEANGIYISGPVKALDISKNTFFGGQVLHPIYLRTDSSNDNRIAISETNILDNAFIDWPTDGAIFLDHQTPNGGRYINIKGNTFNLDPYFRHSDHNADNTWTATNTVMGINFNGRVYAGEMSGNHFWNMGKLSDISGLIIPFQSNFVYLEPDGTGFDDRPLNKGVRHIPFNSGHICVQYNADPASATYGALVNGIPAISSSAMPTTGFYFYGHFERNVSPAVQGVAGSRYTISGWRRLNTGSTHVLNTDWVEVRCPTGT
jgi:hypothetical protein